MSIRIYIPTPLSLLINLSTYRLNNKNNADRKKIHRRIIFIVQYNILRYNTVQ